jgi:hypothetical protein
MSRLILVLLAFSVAFAQEKPAAAPAAETAKPAEEVKPAEEQQAETPAVEGAAAPEAPVRGSVEVGYRFVGDIRGNQDTYRSVVNLGEGPRLLNMDLSMSPSLKWIDDLTVRANSWGGDPYNTAHFRAGKHDLYRLEVDYRNIAYFNALPSFANPGLETGLLFNQRSYDITRRFADVNLDILPWGKVIPFFGYTHSAGVGRGVTLYVPRSNEYPVPTELDDSMHQYRGGVRIETSRFHVTVEQGAFQFDDNQRVYETQLNRGNRSTPVAGQNLVLQQLQAQYGISGDAYFSRAAVTANPFSWLDVFGNWIFTQPKIESRYTENAAGNFLSGASDFLPTQQLAFNAISKQPHNRAHAGVEVRPVSRVRIIESIYTDRMHTGSSADRLEINYNQNQLEFLFEPADRMTVRAGHRLTWGDSANRAPSLASFPGLESGRLRRNTGLAGISYRLAQKVSFNVDAEVARSESAYFRTSLRNYERYRARIRYQALDSLSFAWSGAFLNNDNPNIWTRPDLGDYDLTTLDNSLSFVWTPKGGSKFRATGEYARSTWRSDLLYLAPQDLTPERSFYRENGHAGTLMVDFVPTRGTVRYAPRFSAGGSFFRSAGSRPTRYWQPTARAAVPLMNHVDFVGEWRYWGLSQPFYSFEHFRNHQATLSLRFWQ